MEFDFDLGESVQLLRQTVRDFAAELIAPRAAQIDASNVFPRDLWPELGSLGLLGITVNRVRRKRPRLSRACGRHGRDQPGLGFGRPVLRRSLQSVHEPDPPLTAATRSSAATCPKLRLAASTSARWP